MATAFLEKVQIPEGFEEVLHDLLKEILREQPENINIFCVEYFKAKRNNTAIKGTFVRNEFGVNREKEAREQDSEWVGGRGKENEGKGANVEEEKVKIEEDVKVMSLTSNNDLEAEKQVPVERMSGVQTTNSMREVGDEYMEHLAESIAKES